MKTFAISFFFPTQPGGRQEFNVTIDASNVGTAVNRAWWEVKRSPRYSGKRGLDHCRIGVTMVSNGKASVTSETQAGG